MDVQARMSKLFALLSYLSVLYNYFDSPKLSFSDLSIFRYLTKFLDISRYFKTIFFRAHRNNGFTCAEVSKNLVSYRSENNYIEPSE